MDMNMVSETWSYIVQMAFLIGLLANITALWILHKTAKRRNKKHLFMLRCLATNDLMAQIGMIILTNQMTFKTVPPSAYCPAFVVVRAFGLGSGCVAFVMALERWLALTRPFLYHQLVTPQMLKRFLACLWLTAVTLTYFPFFGFGLYIDAEKEHCVRFRYATEPQDVVYAYLFFAFGATLCLCIAFCNSSVICELSRIRSQQRVLVRRISRSIISNRVGCARYQTPEEVAFAKLMAFVCVIYVACWAPQVMTVPIAQYFGLTSPSDPKLGRFFKGADMGLSVYLLLDPFVYVLQGYFEGGFKVSVPVAQILQTAKYPRPTAFEKMADMLLCIYFLLDPFVYVLQNYFEGRLKCCGKKEKILPTASTNSTTVGNTTPTTVLLQEPIFAPPKNGVK